MKKNIKFDIWFIVSISILFLYLIFLVYPMLNVLKQSVIGRDGSLSMENFAKFFSQKYYSQTLFNSFKVAVATTVSTLILGIPLSYFYNTYEIRGKNILQILIILCTMSAPFIGAYSWILLLGRGGVITKIMKSYFGIKLPSIYGFGGILLVLSTKFFPLVFLYVSGALKNIDNSLLEASANMGCTGFERFRKIIMPLCMPSILASALLVFMRSMADFGTPLLIGEGYRTFPVEIYNSYVGETRMDHNFAAAISVIAIGITTIIFLLQKILSNKYSFSIESLNPIERKKANGFTNFLIHAYAYILVSISILPQIYIVYTSFLNTSPSGSVFKKGFSFNSYSMAYKRIGSAIPNTIIICGLALLVVIMLSILASYPIVRRKNLINDTIDILSMVPYIIPGSVVGISLVVAFNKKPLILVGTMSIMIIAMSIRRMPYTIRSSVSILQQIPVSVEEASISLGTSKIKTFFKITVPMMLNGIISGAILSWVTIITELSTSIILYNVRSMTLTVGVYSLVSGGIYGPAAATSAILTILTVISLLIFIKISKSKEIIL